MTTKYRENMEAILDPAYRDQNILPICESFDRDSFDKVLAQPGCMGLRMYLGMDDRLEIKFVIVGVNAEGHDMINGTLGKTAARTQDAQEEEDLIIDQGLRCPTNCPPSSSLNQ